MNKNTSLRSPLGHVRGLGSAKSGTHHWWMMRVTSVALIPLSIYPLVMLIIHAMYGDYASVTGWLHSPFAASGIVLFLGFSLHHAANGLQVVIEDYLHHEGMKTFLLLGLKLGAVALFVLGSLATLKVMFGA